MNQHTIIKSGSMSSISTCSRSRASSSFLLKSCLIALIFLVDACTASLPCSCSPLVYNWTLSLNSECPETLPANDGLGSNSICKILTTTLDPVVRVSALRFYEYGSDLGDLVTFRFYSGNWTEGDSMSAESITKTEPDVFSSSAGFELTGYTAAGKDVAFQWLVDHTNACGEDPYQNIKSIGWMKFADQVPASDDTCAPCEAKSSKSGKSWSYPNKSSKSSKSAKCKKTVYKVKSAKDSKEAKSSRSKGGYRRK